jgi:hypothetical protein
MDCGYNTCDFHHKPCRCCGSYEFKTRVVTTHLSWNKNHLGYIQVIPIKIRKVVSAQPPCEIYSYEDLAEIYRVFRRKEIVSKEKFCSALSPSYRIICKGILKTMRKVVKDYRRE